MKIIFYIYFLCIIVYIVYIFAFLHILIVIPCSLREDCGFNYAYYHFFFVLFFYLVRAQHALKRNLRHKNPTNQRTNLNKTSFIKVTYIYISMFGWLLALINKKSKPKSILIFKFS